MEMFKLIAGAVFIAIGLFIFGVATLGLFRFSYVLNRVHVAAKCDSLAALFVCIGLMFFSTGAGAIIKLLVIAAFIWLTNPVASHLVCKIEVETNENLENECEVEELP
ncbi:MAG: monovalent cation/H(+) antiporter subunit G [Oscillospiraceae bacterium]|nr:monovalent cation/H(+) antiporter subunit G [Oscillospiraceae bacterium]